jgi:predicted dehydrogenase
VERQYFPVFVNGKGTINSLPMAINGLRFVTDIGLPDYRMPVDDRKGDIWIPHLEGKEALTLEVEHFVDCIWNERPPLSGGPEGLQLIRILEAATQSLFLKGQPIPL